MAMSLNNINRSREGRQLHKKCALIQTKRLPFGHAVTQFVTKNDIMASS